MNITPFRLIAAVLLAGLALRAPAAEPTGAGEAPARLDVVAKPAILVFQGAATTRAALAATPYHFTPSRYRWAQVPDPINPLRSAGTVTFSDPNAPAPTATFSSYGVYQIQLTAASATQTVTRSTWVHVWDSTPVLGRKGGLGSYPGLTPPASVRQLSSDPGPFQHPRVLFSNQDWPEMSRRDAQGKLASAAVAQLRAWVRSTLDNPKSSVGKLAQDLNAYAQATGAAPAPDITHVGGHTTTLGTGDGDSFYGALLAACYLAWIDQDPSVSHDQVPPAKQARFQLLARVTAAAAKLHFAQIWDRRTGAFNKSSPLFLKGMETPGSLISARSFYPLDLGMAYDLIYSWMTPDEQADVRDFFYAISYGRPAWGGMYQDGPDKGTPLVGPDQNGDFANENDQVVLGALAVDGEQSAVSPDVLKAFSAAKPGTAQAHWLQPTGPADPAGWTGATGADVFSLQREINWTNQWYVSPWGFITDNLAYYSLSAKWSYPTVFALARRGENQFVTTYIYNGIQAALYTAEPGEGVGRSPFNESSLFIFDHHDSGTFQKGALGFLWKYMYPDDPAVDFVYANYLPSQFRQGHFSDPLLAALWGLDPGVDGRATGMAEMAQAKKLPLTKFDPQLSVAIARNGWHADDANLYFDCGWYPRLGHMHAEKNSFAFYALGRAWSVPPGYHGTLSDLQAAVLIQDPKLAADPATHGYAGESPSSVMQKAQATHPTPSGHLLEVADDPAGVWTLFAGDAAPAYRYAIVNENGPQPLDTGLPLSSLMYPGLYENLLARIGKANADRISGNLRVSVDNYNTVRYAIRSVLFVRGPRPYALIVDDINKDGAPRNYEWIMNGSKSWDPTEDNRFLGADGKAAYSSLAMRPGATSTEAILYHSPIDDAKTPGQAGLPRLLVRDVSEQSAATQPPIVLESKPPGKEDDTYLLVGINKGKPQHNSSNRLLIVRQNVIEPKFKVLLFPYRTGELMPITGWNADHTRLTIDLENGTVDTLEFTPSPADHRTRIVFRRTTK